METESLLPIKLTCNDHEIDKDTVVIEVKQNLNKLLDSPMSVVDKGESSRQSIQPSIHKVPDFMRKIQDKAFEPQFVSFGPYHHGKSHLASMELEKKKVFKHFITNYKLEFESIVESVANDLENLWGAYVKLEDKWKREDAGKFMEMIIVDGCFMLDFLKECPPSLSAMSSDIKRDMLVLENQLPMRLLQTLHNKTKESKDLRSLLSDSMSIKVEGVTGKELHILDMYRKSLLSPKVDRRVWNDSGNKKTEEEDEEQSRLDSQIIPQATLLRDAGIKFKRSPTNSLTDVDFDHKQGVLKLPRLEVDDHTETTLLNVMAFEKLHVKTDSKVTSFVILMNNLIDVQQDVALLSSATILANALGNNESAAELFSLLGKGATLNLEDNITNVHMAVNIHCKQPWNNWCASLKHDYFHNPWAVISLLAATFGFAILIVQAVYQIVDYHMKGK